MALRACDAWWWFAARVGPWRSRAAARTWLAPARRGSSRGSGTACVRRRPRRCLDAYPGSARSRPPARPAGSRGPGSVRMLFVSNHSTSGVHVAKAPPPEPSPSSPPSRVRDTRHPAPRTVCAEPRAGIATTRGTNLVVSSSQLDRGVLTDSCRPTTTSSSSSPQWSSHDSNGWPTTRTQPARMRARSASRSDEPPPRNPRSSTSSRMRLIRWCSTRSPSTSPTGSWSRCAKARRPPGSTGGPRRVPARDRRHSRRPHQHLAQKEKLPAGAIDPAGRCIRYRRE